jgi:hypothetical protein
MTDSRTVVRYRVHAGRGDENEVLVRAVFEELHRARPAGIDYATLRLEDGVSFLHVATAGSGALLGDVDTFRAFQAGVPERAEEPPEFASATLIGDYRAGARDRVMAATNSSCSSGATGIGVTAASAFRPSSRTVSRRSQ